MKKSKLLFFTLFFFCCIYSIYSQSLQSPSLTHKTTPKTLIIDSIPLVKPNKFAIAKGSNSYNKYAAFFSTSDSYPSFDISTPNRQIASITNAFNHPLLSSTIRYSSNFRETWDNPFGSDSFEVGVISGSINLISSFFQ